MAAPYILARTLRDAHDFARGELGLARGKYRVVTSPSTLSGRRGTDLYLVPGYQNRHDRFAMRGALRYTRLNVIDVEQMRAEEPLLDGLTPVGTQPELTEGADPTLVAEFEAFLNGVSEHPHEPSSDESTEAWSEDGTEELAEEPTESTEPEQPEPVAELQTEESETKRRRRRCKECGILVEPDEVEQHASEHLPTEQ